VIRRHCLSLLVVAVIAASAADGDPVSARAASITKAQTPPPLNARRDDTSAFPACESVPLVSDRGWQQVQYERFSLRLPDDFRVPRGPIAFDHGGRLWTAHKRKVSISKIMLSARNLALPGVVPFRICQTGIGKHFAAVKELEFEDLIEVEAWLPDFGIMVSAQSRQTGDWPLLRSIVRTLTIDRD
jgi:hypothetical protein